MRAWKTRKDKVVRMHDAAPLIQSGRVYVPYPPKALDVIQKSSNFVTEICDYPDVAHDDLHDAMTQFLLYCKEKGILAPEGWQDVQPFSPDEYDEDEEGVVNYRRKTYAQTYLKR